MNRLFPALGATLAGLAIVASAACSDVSPTATTATTPTVEATTATQSAQVAAPSAVTTSTQAAAGKRLSVAELVKLADPSVVRIETSGGVGSGFVVDPDGYIVTNNHVVTTNSGRTATALNVTMSDGTILQGRVVGADPRSDIAIVKVEAASKLSALEFANLDDVAIGEDVVAIGYALDLRGGEGPSYTVTRGIISQKNRAIQESSNILGAIQTDAAINHGNSGGPLLLLTGEVVGVNTSLVPDKSSATGTASGIGLAVGSDTVRAVYEQIKSTGRVNRGLLGIQAFQALRPAKAKELGIPADIGGVYLPDANSVVPNQPAAKAGLQGGDVITKIGPYAIQNEGDLAVALIKSEPNAKVNVEIYRAGKQMTLEVTLGAPAQQ